MSDAMIREAIIEDLKNTRQTIYVGFAGFTILIWDHLVTIGDEVELIWKAPKGILGYLFLLNRYLTPLGFTVNLVAYNLPTWSDTRCRHFVRYEGSMTSIGIEIVGLMMLIRVCAMYKYQRAAIALAMVILLVWVSVTGWLLSDGEPVAHSNNIHSCTMIFDSGSFAAATAWLPLLYDTYVFVLTLYRTYPSIHNEAAGNVVRTLFKDGLLYYSVICTVNLVLTIMIVKAPNGLRNIAAQLELLLTVTMMSRITLNLKKQAYYGSSPEQLQLDSIVHPIPTSSRGVVPFGRLRSKSIPSAHPLGGRMRSRSANAIPSAAGSVIFAHNSPLSTLLPSSIPTSPGSVISPVRDHVSWLQNERNNDAPDIV